ncbi:MAG: response regulator [Acetobacteraceae bacterium]|nr:response regulator [Acetobacteraceae bacterium]
MTHSLQPTEPGQHHRLEEENRKLRRINKVLMDRMERDADAQRGNAYSLFQTAITLESKVAERTTELTRLTHRLMHEISERRAAEEALKVAKAEAEQANLSKTKFLAAASHDLHQPLNAARLFLGALTDEVRSDRALELIARADAAMETVGELLSALLDISKLDAGVWPVKRSDFAIGPLLERLGQEYRPQAEALGLELRIVPSSALGYTDRHLLERILRNLISNAIRYTESGRILIGCRRQQGGFRIGVWDTGIGIAEADRARIFEEFQRLGNEPRRQEKGLGLGLAMVGRIATLLDLQLGVRSRLGHGSSFAVGVPRGSETAATATTHTAPPLLSPASLAGRNIVIIENDEQIREALCTLLESWGCTVSAAPSSLAALAEVRGLARFPDLIIADYRLDHELGTEAIHRFRAEFGSLLPALVISSDRSQELKAEAESLGFGFLPKPTPPAKMRAMVSFLLRRPAR